jgi:hypothetical protein
LRTSIGFWPVVLSYSTGVVENAKWHLGVEWRSMALVRLAAGRGVQGSMAYGIAWFFCAALT